ncbi:MAG: transposase [Synechococcaceae cyanobacterium SM1_2_3]|nr:transposase [Synechococcaceae cyanobacterium SM1_2_3]
MSPQENRVWQTVNEIYQQNARQELDQRLGSTISEVGMDEFSIKKGHRHYATVIVDL